MCRRRAVTQLARYGIRTPIKLKLDADAGAGAGETNRDDEQNGRQYEYMPYSLG